MILHWEQLVLHYGAEVNNHKVKFEEAGQTTYGLLCCRFAPGDDRLTSSASAGHAEERLLQSEHWKTDIAKALNAWTDFSSKITVTITLNRSPCRNCTALLVAALNALHRRFPVACERNQFVLASRGAYEDADMLAATTKGNLRSLRDAGWRICVLQLGHQLSPRGRMLLQAIEDVAGRGFVRLG